MIDATLINQPLIFYSYQKMMGSKNKSMEEIEKLILEKNILTKTFHKCELYKRWDFVV